ncbi:DEAD/DEAH box helicase [Liquorilactobacillus hordei]|uniref:DEAD/DEAH box helicase n=1 Tax=Liquorilactobacillus hordei TaxID=468911 RepID=UPI001CBCB912|nr:DEAD/DEAH box helicase [Liquorilactobacillus hordei]MBZ2405767.1 helicase [Liquorilactobacillus hordei]
MDIDKLLKKDNLLDISDSFSLAKYTSSIIDNAKGRQILIHVLDIWSKVNNDTKEIWENLIERAGFYPYLDSTGLKNLSFQAVIRREWYKSENLQGIYFHAKQKIIEQNISRGRNIAVSAPTSFGKSLLIEEVVARNVYKNILIIQPTLALIDETRRRLQKYAEYNMVMNTMQQPSEKNIFILTAERVLEYKNLPKIDFLIVDEFYKVSSRAHDNRQGTLNIALSHVLAGDKVQSLYLTPSIDAISEEFLKKYNIYFFKTDYSLVNTEINEIRYNNSRKKKDILFDMLASKKEPSLVYVSSPTRAYQMAVEYLEYLKSDATRDISKQSLLLTDWISDNISEKWKLNSVLEYGIGVHNGELPRHVVSSQLEYFNQGKLKVMFVTTSLIEGVNTSAKNMFIFDEKKGKIKLDYFDFSNIVGRAGRMKKYFTGEIYLFGERPQKDNFQIDVPFVEQTNASDEVLINLPNSDMKDSSQEKIEILKKTIPFQMIEIIKNNYISVEGQKKLYQEIENDYLDLQDKLVWKKTVPTYLELSKTLWLVYKCLEDTKSQRYTNGLASQSLIWVESDSIKGMISRQYSYYVKQKKFKDDTARKERAISFVLSFIRKEAGYKIPKYLGVIQSIQEYVYKSHGITPGDYSFFAALLENGQANENLNVLVDLGIPTSAIKKISKKIPENLETDQQVIQYIKKNMNDLSNKLDPYEIELINRI